MKSLALSLNINTHKRYEVMNKDENLPQVDKRTAGCFRGTLLSMATQHYAYRIIYAFQQVQKCK